MENRRKSDWTEIYQALDMCKAQTVEGRYNFERIASIFI